MVRQSMFVLCLFAASPIVAQVLVPRATMPAAQLKFHPKLSPVVAQATVELIDLPSEYFTEEVYPTVIRKNLGWDVSRTAPVTGPRGAIGTQIRSAIYRKRTGFFESMPFRPNRYPSNSCGHLPVVVDLSAFRDRGFHLSAVRIDPVLAANMAEVQQPSIALVIDRGVRSRQAREMSQAFYIYVNPEIAERVNALPGSKGVSYCHSEYYLHMSLTGPKGIDPNTGKPYPPRSQVN